MIEKHFVAHPTWLVESITELFRKMFASTSSTEQSTLWDHGGGTGAKNQSEVGGYVCPDSPTMGCSSSSANAAAANGANNGGGCCVGIGKSIGRNGTSSFQRAKRRHFNTSARGRDCKSCDSSTSFLFSRDKRHFKNCSEKNQCHHHHHHHNHSHPHHPHSHHHPHHFSSFSQQSNGFAGCGGGGTGGTGSSFSSYASAKRAETTRWRIYCIVMFVSVANYLNSLPGDFVHDDLSAIKTNDDVKGQTPIWSIFLNDFWGKPMADRTSHKSYRPFTILSFR